MVMVIISMLFLVLLLFNNKFSSILCYYILTNSVMLFLGTYTSIDGDLYEGDFYKDTMHGRGKIRYAIGIVFNVYIYIYLIIELL